MNAVIGYTDMLLEGRLSRDQREYADTIKSSGDTLLNLINDILDFSKIEAGELDFDESDFDPEPILYEVCDIIRPKIGTRPIEIVCRISPLVPTLIHGDPGRFRQVLINLMGNAPKFTELGEIELSVDVDEELDDRIKLHCRIRDTGIGISPEKLISIFEPFKQADGTTTRKYGGTGLGLSICKKISNLLGGDVWAESPPVNSTAGTANRSDAVQEPEHVGIGSLFHFTAWFKKADPVNRAPSIPVSLAHKKILIVDDNATNLNILEHVLQLVEIEVVSLNNGREVFPVLQSALKEKAPFDAVIVDIQMPDMDGYDVAETIRAAGPPIKDLPLIALSSVLERDVSRNGSAWFDCFLTKPIRRERLYDELKRKLDGRKAALHAPKRPEQETSREDRREEDKEHAGRILLVEDNLVNQKLARMMLSKAGFQVDVADNGKEAVEKATGPGEPPYHIVFMDVQMPEMDGIEATREIRKWEDRHNSAKGWKRQPIVAMTAHAMKGDREKCIEAGMDDYLTKPIKKNEVLEMAHKWMRNLRRYHGF